MPPSNASNAAPVRAAGRLLIGGFPGLYPPPDFWDALAAGEMGGVILFAANYESPEQVAAVIRELRARAPWPILVGVDQEGGRVQRFRAPFTVLPEMARVGERGDPALAHRVGRLLGTELAAIGVNWNFAPVLDVHTNPANPVIGRRAFGSEPALVAELGVALARGLEEAGVLSCGKHFPGHGDTREDSHHELPVLPHDLERLRAVELVPFAAYARAKLGAVMTAHVLFPALDNDLPATLSRRILGLLRDELAYDGLLVSDDLEMKAVADRFPVEELVLRGLSAGIDVFLVCHNLPRIRRAAAALRQAANGPAALDIAVSLRRLDDVCRRFAPRPAESPLPLLGSEAHQRVLEEIAG